MRARMKRRRLIRRVTIIGTIGVIAISLAVGIYLASQAGRSSIDFMIGQPVSASDQTALYQLSLQPYGPAPPTSMASIVKPYAGSAFTSDGKPVVVYIGGEFCPYCAIQRWSLIMALDRFGNFTGLQYMASSASEGDYPTFTFASSSYTSKYVVFQPYEAEDRGSNPLQTVPTNYTTAWQQYRMGFPFMNFADAYIIPVSTTSQIGLLQGKNWTEVIDGIRVQDATGQVIKQSANLLTAVICKLTGNLPASVCDSSPIADQVLALGGPTTSTALTIVGSGPPQTSNLVSRPRAQD